MKRKVVHVHPSLFRHRGWFAWQECARCKAEFRREAGWRFLTGPFVNGAGHWNYLCFSCGGPTPETATECIHEIENHRLDNRPDPPPMPPPCRYVRESGGL